MKVSKMPGFGSLGTIVEDFEWDQPQAYEELRELNIKSLVTVVRGDGVNRFDSVVKNMRHVVATRPGRNTLKYGLMRDYSGVMTEEEEINQRINGKWMIGESAPGWVRVTGKRDEEGNTLGAFGDTELLWHSNEFARPTFAPVVVLYGMTHMNTSATCFVHSADWYDKQSESFRSELNELISICDWDKNALMPSGDSNLELNMRMAFVPQNGSRMPLVMDSVGGSRGLHYSKFIVGFEGMTKADSDKIINKIESELFVPEYQYDYWWDNPGGDLVLFEQSITLHMRKIVEGLDLRGELKERNAHRLAGDYRGHINYNGFLQKEFRDIRQTELIAKLNDPSYFPPNIRQ
jgi:hypothetical protein